MDPDIPIPSIESDHPGLVGSGSISASAPAPVSTRTGEYSGNSSPSRRTSPDKTPYRTPMSHAPTPTPLKTRSISRAGTPNHERRSPILQSKRSLSNLSVNQGGNSTTQFRRASSNLNPTSPGPSSRTSILGEMTKPSPWTASSVAKDYFKRELDMHTSAKTKVAVIVHDACYGHRFSRPKTTKAMLNTIVERPERIHATLLGASTAYVRLGDRHATGRHKPHPDREASTIGQPPFTIHKTTRSIALNHPAVTSVHGTKWMEELQIMCDSAEAKLTLNGKELVRPIGYGKDEEGKPLPKLHEGDLYLCAESWAALQGCLGGVCDAVDTVFSSGPTSRAFVCIRPPGHHCSANYPSGFCWLNNVHVGISYAAINHNLTHAAIIDFDLHHGDGSQAITWDHNQDAQTLPKNAAAHKKVPIGYYSLHDINSYPCEWGDMEKVQNASLCIHNAHGQSIWNVHLEPWESLDDFWRLYETKYTVLLDKTRSFLRHHAARLRAAGLQPRAAIFLSAGFDASQWEGEGMQRHNVNVPTDFYARFTRDVVRLSEEADLAVGGRVISVLEGGYSDRALTSGVLSHICGLTDNVSQGMSESTTRGILGMPPTSKPHVQSSVEESQYDANWWSQPVLEELEAIVSGHMPVATKRKDKQAGNYSSPTQASTARMTYHARERQSLTSQLEARLSLESAIVEPPPEVDWTVASYELSRLLIPTDRQTLSCRHDELNAEATRVRRERQSILELPTQHDERMQLRDRKTKVLTTREDGPRAASRNTNRRTTIAAASELPDPTMADGMLERPRRRSSASSSVLSNFQNMKLDDQSFAISRSHVASNDTARRKAAVPTNEKTLVGKRIRPTAVPRQTRSRANSPVKEMARNNFDMRTSPTEDKVGLTKVRSGSSNARSSPLSRRNSREHKIAADDDEMDELTNGLKKVSIKLKMPTLEQYEAKQRKLEEAKPKPKTARKTAVPRTSKTKPAASTKSATQAKKTSPKGQSARTKTVPKADESISIDMSHGQQDVVATMSSGAEQSMQAPSSLIDQVPMISHNIPRTHPSNDSAQTEIFKGQPPHHVGSIQALPSSQSTILDIHQKGTGMDPQYGPGIIESQISSSISPQPMQNLVETSQNKPSAVSPSIVPEIPERPEAPTPATVAESEITPAFVSLQPTQSTPQARTKEDLPVFTATSTIPFSRLPQPSSRLPPQSQSQSQSQPQSQSQSQ